MKNSVTRILYIIIFLLFAPFIKSIADDGYNLWLRYPYIENSEIRRSYISQIKNVIISESEEFKPSKKEMDRGLSSMLGIQVQFSQNYKSHRSLFITDAEHLPSEFKNNSTLNIPKLGIEDFIIITTKIKNLDCIFIIGGSPVGSLYGSYHFLRLIQMGENISKLNIYESPKVKLRLLNHWDNLDRTVERGYAGFSIWDWHRLPEFLPEKYTDYARANASIGINGTVLSNVNANSLILTEAYLEKAASLANIFRPYGIKVYLTARFSSPIEIGGLSTADPINSEVRQWWKEKVREIYQIIPDFGGFLVKANSEGQPGPQDYERSHADGANMMAEALEEYGGVVMWRAFVYSEEVPDDRAKQAYTEFKALDGEFMDNVIIQVKNGPIDFQPREPFHPLFGATPETNIGMEFQITQEYLGQGTHLVYLAPLFKECLDSDTYARGEGSAVSRVIDGSMFGNQLTCIAGVSNIGTDRNWTGHHFGQANWYAFGRLAWNHKIRSDQISREWLGLTFSIPDSTIEELSKLMNTSREACVNYMTPMGLHHIMGEGHHYGPGPWVDNMRPDWTSVYYHQADNKGIGFDRTKTGSNAIAQYFPQVRNIYENPEKCPEEYLLWFHHLPWDFKLQNDKILWDEICFKYDEGLSMLGDIVNLWKSLEKEIDSKRFQEVSQFLDIQKKEAYWWRDACLSYFQSKSGLEFPDEVQKPKHDLEYYINLSFPYAPGIKPEW